MKVLITGGSGFIGTNLMEYYLSKGVEVINFSTDPPKKPEHKPYWKEVDILDNERLKREIRDFSPTYILNLAGRTGISEQNNLQHYATNFEGVRNLISATKNLAGLQRIIFTSSMLVCRPDYTPRDQTDYCPNTLYGQSKMLGEKVVREAGDLPYSWAIVRPTGIWGPWFEAPYTSLFKLIRMGLYVHPATSHPVQSLGFVGNTVHQYDRLMRAPDEIVHGKMFYLADHPPTDLREWMNLVQRALKAPPIREVPIWVLRGAAKTGDMMKAVGWSNAPLYSSRLQNLLRSFVFDLEHFLIEGLPCSLEQGVEITVNWYENILLKIQRGHEA